MKAPICPSCGSQCSPSGGSLVNPEIKFWTCWSCNIEINDIPIEIIKDPSEDEIRNAAKEFVKKHISPMFQDWECRNCGIVNVCCVSKCKVCEDERHYSPTLKA